MSRKFQIRHEDLHLVKNCVANLRTRFCVCLVIHHLVMSCCGCQRPKIHYLYLYDLIVQSPSVIPAAKLLKMILRYALHLLLFSLLLRLR